MTFARPVQTDPIDPLPPVPGWITRMKAQTPEDAAFLAGGMLSHLHLVMQCDSVPHPVLRDRLALRAAEACVAFSGRPERAGELRDAVHLLRPGDLPGPAGACYLGWRRGVARPVSIAALHRALPEYTAKQIAGWMDAGQGAPLVRAATVLQTVLRAAPRAETATLLLADAALAQALGWRHLLPVLAAGLTRADLRKQDAALQLACHRAVIASGQQAVRMASDLSRRAAYLRAVAPKLRAKAAGAAVEMFLTQEAVAPAALPLPDRAARRLCDRLVDLGAVREVTGRDTFRLYGL